MANTTTTEIPSAVNNYYDKKLLKRALPLFLHTLFAQIRNIPRNNSAVIKFRKYGALVAATTPLSEGITPTGSQLSKTDVTATVQQYGDFVTLTDKLMFTTFDPILRETAMLLGEQYADTIDQLTRDILAAGTSIQYASTATSRVTVGAAMKMATTEIREAVRTLKNANARKLSKMVNPSTGYDTTPLRPTYVAICHPDTTYDLEGMTGWKPVEKYASQTKLFEGEVGSYSDVRFIETTNAKVFAGAGAAGIDVYITLIIGADAYGTTRISGEAIKNIIKPLGSAGTSDPLDQRATSGWKATFVAKILQQAFMLRIEHAVT